MTLLLALLLAASPIEQSHGPYARPTNGAQATAAAARGSALLAWSEADRIHVGRLDTHARLASEIRTLPATTARAVAVAPAAASDGVSFLVAWLELGGGQQRTMAMLVDVLGTPIGMPRQYATDPVESNDFAVRLAWDGSAYRLWTGRKLIAIDTSGTVLSTTDLSAIPQSATARNGVVATTSLKVTFHCGFGWCSRTYDLVWAAGSSTGSERVGFTYSPYPAPPPIHSPSIIAAAGDQFGVAWSRPWGIHYLLTGDGTNLVAASPDTSIAPGLACDDEQCVIAYAQSNDVHALAFPVDRLTGPELLTIAATERVERAPQVYLLGTGRFLITYRSDGSDGARLNWRMITFGAPRRRALR